MKPAQELLIDIARRKDMRRLSCISPYLVVLVMPGGMLVLPVLAWWLDRRRNRRPSSTVVQG